MIHTSDRRHDRWKEDIHALTQSAWQRRLPTMTTTTKWTIHDYHRMIDAGILDDRRVELLHGDIVDMPPEGTPHAAYSQEGGDYLRQVLGNRVKIRESKPVTLPNTTSEPEPDIAVVVPHPIEVYLEHHPYPEDIFWLIEFSNSSLNQDLETKNLIYAGAEIQEYWVINLREMKLIVFREPEQSGYRSEVEMTTGEIQPLAFPDVTVSVGRILGKQ